VKVDAIAVSDRLKMGCLWLTTGVEPIDCTCRAPTHVQVQDMLQQTVASLLHKVGVTLKLYLHGVESVNVS
jgi:hypothetical protein